jgi:hypothetical protein
MSLLSALIALLDSGRMGAADAGAKALAKSRAATSPVVANAVRMRISL